MAAHGARDHATWSASATARNWACPGAIALSGAAAPERESIHAARGTAAHQVAEKCLRQNRDPSDFLGEVEKTKQHDVEIDEELADSAAEYVDYVRAAAAKPGAVLQLEQNFSLASLDPPFDAGGTADTVVYFPAERLLEVVDFKNGMGLVEVQGNPQLRTYALGAMLANPGLAVDRIRVTVVQPRAPHSGGRVRSETFHVVDLVEWTADLMAAMRAARAAKDEWASVTGELTAEAWGDKWLRPGDTCKFCRAEGFCPALKKRALAVAEVWFDAGDQPKLGNQPGAMSPEKLAETLDLLPLLEDWIKAVRALAHRQAEDGVQIPGYQLAEKIGNRKWAADDAKVAADLKAKGVPEADIFEAPKLRSVAQMEKTLGSKRKKLIENMWHRPVTGTNLVSVDKTTRPPAKTTAERYFENVT
jgi:hypothetical protein